MSEPFNSPNSERDLLLGIVQMFIGYQYSIQYYDDRHAWTVPVVLTEDRFKKLDDHSILTIRIIGEFGTSIDINF